MMIRDASIRKLSGMSPYAAFRVGLYEDARRMWMHLAKVYKRRGDEEMTRSSAASALAAHRSFLNELSRPKDGLELPSLMPLGRWPL